MAINISNEYPEFRITDTLHQLVDRLNQLTDLMDSNTRLFDSSLNNVLSVIDSQGEGLINDSNIVINSLAGSIDITADSGFSVTAGDNLTLRADKTITVDAGEKLIFNTDSGDILLRSQGTQFGAIKKVTGVNELEFWTGNDLVLGFDGTLNATFSGPITMPTSGLGSPSSVTARTVHGALDEIVLEHDSDHANHETRIVELETKVATLRSDVDSDAARIDVLDSDVNDLQLQNIASRLETIESQIIQINNRLDILQIFT